MNFKDDVLIIDQESTEKLFGDVNIAAHLYHILYGMLRPDHEELIDDCKNGHIETAKSMIHRIKGALKYCKAPEYESVILELEQAIINNEDLQPFLLKLEASCERLYKELERVFPVKCCG